MTRLKTILTTLTILTAGFAVLIAPEVGAESTATPIGFGMESSAINVQTSNGVAPDYGTFWLGPWTLNSGWGGPDAQLTNMKNQGVTPAIHFYYWGDDISPSCVENGCWSSLHNTQKDRAGWNRLADEMVSHLNSKMQGEEVVIFMESEFNKGGIETYEPFDGYLADMNQKIKAGYPNAEIVLSLGSWGRHHWGNFDRSAATSDLVGIQGMRGSTRDSSAHYDDLYETTLDNAKFVQNLFGKPVFIQDLALSSYPEPQYLSRQANELQQFFDNLPALKQAGVMAIVYRSWNDSPGMNLANYYGEAERHWGLSWGGTTDLKQAGYVWINGVKAERANAAPAPAPGPTPAPGAFDATFTVPGNVNQYWVEVRVQSHSGISKVEASHNGGAFTTLPATSWGSHAKSFYAPAGSMVFKATSTTGATVTSDSMSWLGGAPAPAPEPEPTPAFTASFNPRSVGNEYWVETAVSSTSKISKVEARVDGVYTTLPATSWGTYAKSFHVAPGAMVTFRATDAHGQAAMSQPVAWGKAPVNHAPVASLATTTSDMRVSADASGSSDVDGDALSYTIEFGDGSKVSMVKASHTYTKAGTYTVKVTVSDGQVTSTSSKTVTVTQPTPAFAASFNARSVGNEYWVETSVAANNPIRKVEASVDGGAFTVLPATSWGTYAKSFHVAPGAMVTFRATDAHGQAAMSQPVAWGKAPVAFDAHFGAKAIGNAYWIETTVRANEPIDHVDARINGGNWFRLSETSWDSFSANPKMGSGATVQFRAVSVDGDSDTSRVINWT